MIAECQAQLVGFKQGKELRALLRKGHFQEVAGECAELLRGDLYRDFIQNTFRREGIVPTKIHHLLLGLPLGAIVTTNYDNLIERTYARKLPSDDYPLTYTSKNVAKLPRLCTEKRFFIFKMHGDADDIETVVLTKKDYQNIIHSSPLYQTSLAQIFAARTALFIGYGLRDQNLDLILSAQASLFKDYGRRHYAFFPDAGTILPKSFSEHYNITIIPYSSKNGHKELHLMLEQLSRQVRSLPPSTEDEEIQRLKQLIEVERRYCEKLGTYIEFGRAKFLRSRMHKASFTYQERQLIEKSIQHWETLEIKNTQLESALSQKQKMEALGTLAGATSHEFGRFLATIQSHSSLLAHQTPEGPLRQSADEIIRTAKRAGILVSILQSLGQRPHVNRQILVNVNDLARKVGNLLTSLIGENKKLRLELLEELPLVTGDPSTLEQVLMNLVINARDAIESNGIIIIKTALASITNEYLLDHPGARVGSFACISVTDNGIGISAEDLPRVFEPFFSSKKKKGVGLGLTVSQVIVKQHNGWVEVVTKPGRGSTFLVFLPEANVPQERGGKGDKVLFRKASVGSAAHRVRARRS